MIGSLIGKMADAQKMSIAQIQQSIASGSLPSYIGIPLLQEKAQQAQKLQMAQAILKEQGTPDVTVKDQVMQAADQVTRPEPPVMPSTPDGYRQQPAPSQGVEALASNMPEEYAGGGIIAFADRGVVPGAEDIPIPGRREDRDTRAAGAESLAGPTRPKYDFLGRPYTEVSLRDVGVTPYNAPTDLDMAGRILHGPEYQAPADPFASARRPAPSIGPTREEAAPAPAPARPGVDSLPPITRDGAPSAPPAAEAPESAFNDIESLYKQSLEETKTGRQELRDLILGQQADRAERQKTNVGTSLMEAGFGMMAGESPFAGVNIGRGAMAGAKSYAQGLEQLRQDDSRVVNQLVSLGLRGEELNNAAMKMGIDIGHYKAMEPLTRAEIAQRTAETGLMPLKGETMRAGIAETLAGANLKTVQAALLPQELEIKELAAIMKGRKGGAGAAGAKIDPNKLKLYTEYRNSVLSDPTTSNEVMQQLMARKDSKQILDSLKLSPDNPNYVWAQREIGRMLDPYIERLEQQSRAAPEYVPSPTYED